VNLNHVFAVHIRTSFGCPGSILGVRVFGDGDKSSPVGLLSEHVFVPVVTEGMDCCRKNLVCAEPDHDLVTVCLGIACCRVDCGESC